METIAVTTNRHAEFVEITRQVQDAVARSGLTNGTCTVFVPHTTAGVTINEHATTKETLPRTSRRACWAFLRRSSFKTGNCGWEPGRAYSLRNSTAPAGARPG